MLETQHATRGMTTSPHHLASQAGLEVLKEGGNAIEAAISIAASLAVVYPHMTGLGGDGFWLIRSPSGKITYIEGCGRAAQKADVALYRAHGFNAIPTRGPLAANTVAGTVSGWKAALDYAGSNLPLSRLLQGAIGFAKNGVPVTAGGAKVAASKDAEISGVFGYSDVFKPTGEPLKEGNILKQPALARTLSRLVENGLDDFYTGDISADICADLERAGSPVTATDMFAHTAIQTQPLSVQIKGATLYNSPPPTQGATSLLILSLMDRLSLEQGETFEHIHAIVEATKQAFIIRKESLLGDPEYMPLAPQALLDDDATLEALARRIDLKNALPWPHESQGGDTTWFGTADSDGWVVSCIQSTYFEFGSGVVLPKTGLTWQNRGAGFTLSEDGWNALRPGRKPFHTLNPALACFDDGRVMAYGTMGGEGQPQTQAAIFSRYATFGMDLQAAISAPRWLLGRTWGEESETLKLENRFDPSLISELKAATHDVEIVEEFDTCMGHAGAIVLHENGEMDGATDPRSDGAVGTW